MQSDTWVEKAGFRSNRSGFLILSDKSIFDPNSFDRAIRSTHPVEKLEFFYGIRGPNFSIEQIFEALSTPLSTRSSHTAAAWTHLSYWVGCSTAAAAALLLLLLLLTAQHLLDPRGGQEGVFRIFSPAILQRAQNLQIRSD